MGVLLHGHTSFFNSGDALESTRRLCHRMHLPTVQPHELPFRQVALHAIQTAIALGTQTLDEGFGFLDIRQAHEEAPQLEATAPAMNTAASVRSTVDGIASVVLVGEAIERVFMARDGVALMQRQPRSRSEEHTS